MERKISLVEADIAGWTEARRQAIETIGEANGHLLELGSERNRILGQMASRHLYVVPTVTPYRPDIPDGAA